MILTFSASFFIISAFLLTFYATIFIFSAPFFTFSAFLLTFSREYLIFEAEKVNKKAKKSLIMVIALNLGTVLLLSRTKINDLVV